MLGYEDHGTMTVYLTVDYGGACQGIGGYCLDSYDRKADRRAGTRMGLEFIMGVLKACGVESWERVQGRTIFVIVEDNSWNAKVIGLAPLPTERGEEFLFEPWAKLAQAEDRK